MKEGKSVGEVRRQKKCGGEKVWGKYSRSVEESVKKKEDKDR